MLWQILFAATASLLVRDYAVYAKHSGIPEIKTVLGGFVMKKFMGTWTLVIKSLGLVCTYNPSSRNEHTTNTYSVLLSHPVYGLEKKAH